MCSLTQRRSLWRGLWSWSERTPTHSICVIRSTQRFLSCQLVMWTAVCWSCGKCVRAELSWVHCRWMSIMLMHCATVNSWRDPASTSQLMWVQTYTSQTRLSVLHHTCVNSFMDSKIRDDRSCDRSWSNMHCAGIKQSEWVRQKSSAPHLTHGTIHNCYISETLPCTHSPPGKFFLRQTAGKFTDNFPWTLLRKNMLT